LAISGLTHQTSDINQPARLPHSEDPCPATKPMRTPHRWSLRDEIVHPQMNAHERSTWSAYLSHL